MRRKIPSSSALVAFEAAGKHENFSLAAQEINLTEGAVSRQIGRLEAFLGMKLFARVKNRVFLTADGRAYWEQIRSDLERLERHTLNLIDRPADGGTLELAVIPTFTSRWLIPRLPDFFEQSRGVKINMTERPDPFLFVDSPFDAVIHFDHPAWIGMLKIDLFEDELIPVCSPKLCDGRRLDDINQLGKFPLLHKRDRADCWANLFNQLGLEIIDPMDGTWYALFTTIIEAARAGLGIALVPRLYVVNELAQGELIIPFDSSLSSDKRYCLVYPEQRHDSWPLNIFIDWLKKTVQIYEDGRKSE